MSLHFSFCTQHTTTTTIIVRNLKNINYLNIMNHFFQKRYLKSKCICLQLRITFSSFNMNNWVFFYFDGMLVLLNAKRLLESSFNQCRIFSKLVRQDTSHSWSFSKYNYFGLLCYLTIILVTVMISNRGHRCRCGKKGCLFTNTGKNKGRDH